MNKFLFLLMVFVSMTTFVGAVDCDYNMYPIFDNNIITNDKIFVLCDLNNTNVSYCYNMVTENGEVLQVNPEPIAIDMVGMDNKYFEPKGSLVNMYYTNKNLIVGHNYTLIVECALDDGTMEENNYSVIPQYKSMEMVAHRSIWAKENMAYIIMTILFLCVIVFLIRIIRR